eukprot:scaffold10428_cov128-Isochrysis_galbana.AAC.1
MRTAAAVARSRGVERTAKWRALRGVAREADDDATETPTTCRLSAEADPGTAISIVLRDYCCLPLSPLPAQIAALI